jgi:outer membrane protein assembly factor BamA
VAEVGAALVHDTTVFGPTGPLLGSRYRFEIAPSVGTLSYTRVVADYRQYVMPFRPYTVAVRVLHSAHRGPDGDDPRLFSSSLGSNSFVRGYGRDRRYCSPGSSRVCGDDLLGSRLLVGNVEVRVPIWGVLSRQIEYGPLPADAFVFADGGMAWSAAHIGTGITSVGGGIRLNAGGLPLEILAVRALQGPAARWEFDFGFRVGF